MAQTSESSLLSSNLTCVSRHFVTHHYRYISSTIPLFCIGKELCVFITKLRRMRAHIAITILALALALGKSMKGQYVIYSVHFVSIS